MRYALVLEYDGRDFHGWQRQRNARSVQATVEHALSRVADHPVKTICAGRTDAGVHATAQVVHFDSCADRRPESWRRGTNANLPDSASVVWAGAMRDDFNARFSAVERSYRYLILNRPSRGALYHGRAWWVHRPLALDRMRDAASRLIGEHDFSAFRASACQSKTPMRFVSHIEIAACGDLVIVDISANAFLHNMVRIVTGVLVAIGVGEREPGWIDTLLRHRDRRQGGTTAPPDGLYLSAVRYPPQHLIPSPAQTPAAMLLS